MPKDGSCPFQEKIALKKDGSFPAIFQLIIHSCSTMIESKGNIDKNGG